MCLNFFCMMVKLSLQGMLLQTREQAVAAIVLYLGINSIIIALTGGDGSVTTPAPFDVLAINNAIIYNEINLNSLSNATTLALNDLKSRPIFNVGSSTVSGNSLLQANTTLLSSLNVS